MLASQTVSALAIATGLLPSSLAGTPLDVRALQVHLLRQVEVEAKMAEGKLLSAAELDLAREIMVTAAVVSII